MADVVDRFSCLHRGALASLRRDLQQTNNLRVWVALLTLIGFFLSVGSLAQVAVKMALSDYKADLNRQFWTQNTLWAITPAIFYTIHSGVVLSPDDLAWNDL
jgi:hypothetical protein